MTLMTTEIHQVGEGKHVVVFASDRRVTRDGGAETRPDQVKVHRIGERAGVGFSGLAEVQTPAGGTRPMSDFLRDFAETVVDEQESMGELAARLARELSVVVPSDWKDRASTIHLAGLDADDRAELWHIYTFDAEQQILYPEYQHREDFRRRDAVKLTPGTIQIYRQGDLRAHVVAWTQLDESLGTLFKLPGFRPLVTHRDYTEWVKFKFETIAKFYDKFATKPIIGGDVDAFCILPASTANQSAPAPQPAAT